jgi:hypothetical protein
VKFSPSARLFLFVTAASLVLTPLASTANAATKTKAMYSYSCCTDSIVDATYHPGEVIRLTWIATPDASNTGSEEMVGLSAKISGPCKTVASLKSAFARHTPQLGRFNAEAEDLRVSNGVAKRCFSLIEVPRNATADFYELTTTTSIPSLVTSGGAVIRISWFSRLCVTPSGHGVNRFQRVSSDRWSRCR